MTPDWAFWGTVITGGLIPLISWLHVTNKRDQRDRHQELKSRQEEIIMEIKTINNRVTTLEEFRRMHEASDDRRFELLEKNREGQS